MRTLLISYIHENHVSHTSYKIVVRSHDFWVGYHLTTVLNRIEKQDNVCVGQEEPNTELSWLLNLVVIRT